MSLLKRIALNPKDRERKDAATDLLRRKDAARVQAWHQELEVEIRCREEEQAAKRPFTHCVDSAR